uniref:Uncharacterized protein n=1 Tax=Salix viminalis TaxID=40686 RepID=A0A6N2MMN3_SALVM
MQQAIPYKSWLPLYTANKPLRSPSQLIGHHSNGGVVANSRGAERVKKYEQDAVYEIDEADEICVLEELEMICDDGGKGSKKKVQFPALFIGGKLFGGLDRLMATHISGELVPILKEAGALWL